MREFIKREYRVLKRHAKAKKLHKHPLALPIVTFLSLFIITSVGLIVLNSHTDRPSDAHVVRLNVEGQRQTIPTRVNTVGEFLDHAGIVLSDGDVVEPTKDTQIAEDNFRVNVYRARPVIIIDGSKKITALSAARTPRSLVTNAGAQIYPEDKVIASPAENFLVDQTIGEKVVITRATPVFLNLYGTPLSIRTQAKTVQDVLTEHNIRLASGDNILPAASTVITTNTQIFVTRAGIHVAIVEEKVDAPVETVYDTSLSFGTRVIRQVGQAGKKVRTYAIEEKNGQEISRQLIQEVIIAEPVKQIVAVGRAVDIGGDRTGWMSAAGIAESDYAYVNYIVSRESGWCPTKWQGQVGYCPAYYEERYSTSATIGFGLCQSTPPNKMASAGADWQTNPVTQLRWCSGYAQARYGGWGAAYNYWVSHHNW